MILEPTEKTVSGKSFREIFREEPYYVLGYGPNKNILLYTPENEPITGAVASWMQGFGADTYEELINEAANRNLIFPDVIQDS